jgi:hypothetical protein
MPRLTQLEQILFPVEERPVFVSVLAKDGKSRMLAVPNKKAIVNTWTDSVLGVVSRNYRTVKNSQAIEWAVKCSCTVFPETKPSEWDVSWTEGPGTGGHCFIDLVHNSATLDFELVDPKDRPDVFGPFIRVTNSYNGMRALAFDIGFFRKVCKNGMILPSSVIRFKFNHQEKDIGKEIEFKISDERLRKLKADFYEYLDVLRNYVVPRSKFEPLFYGVLQIKKPKEEYSVLMEDWIELSERIDALCGKYFEDLGENAYAVFNVITEFASNPTYNGFIHRDRHSFQQLAGAWLSSFTQECRQPSFSLPQYLAALSKPNGNEKPDGKNPRVGKPAGAS